MFDFLFGKEKKEKIEKEIKEKYLKLFSFFTEAEFSSDALFLIEHMLEDPRAYYKKNKFVFDDLGITEDINLEDLVWTEFVEILKETAIVSEIEDDFELDFFCFSIDRMDNRGFYELSEEIFDPDANVKDWLRTLQNRGQGKDRFMAEMEVDRDGHVIFITDNDALKEMHEIALELNRYIRKFTV